MFSNKVSLRIKLIIVAQAYATFSFSSMEGEVDLIVV